MIPKIHRLYRGIGEGSTGGGEVQRSQVIVSQQSNRQEKYQSLIETCCGASICRALKTALWNIIRAALCVALWDAL